MKDKVCAICTYLVFFYRIKVFEEGFGEELFSKSSSPEKFYSITDPFLP